MSNPVVHFELMGKDAGATVLMPVSKVTEDVTIALFADPAGNITGLLQAQPD